MNLSWPNRAGTRLILPTNAQLSQRALLIGERGGPFFTRVGVHMASPDSSPVLYRLAHSNETIAVFSYIMTAGREQCVCVLKIERSFLGVVVHYALLLIDFVFGLTSIHYG